MDYDEEDLFGQDSNNSKPTNTKIEGRLDELRRGGCNQKIAWSKLGCIAFINADGTGVETRHLACNPTDGQWLLSPAYPVSGLSRNHDCQRLQHVTWSTHGADLAVIDVLGRVSFYTVYVVINALSLVTLIPVDQDDDLCALAGFWWLPPERPYSLHHVVRTEDGNKYHVPTYRQFGPFHPMPNKAAAIGITRNGTIKLWYHDGISKYQSVTCELESSTSLDDVFSHAAIASTLNREGAAVLAAYTHSRQLRIYRVVVNWGIPPQPQQQGQMPKPVQSLPGPPVLNVSRIKIVDSAFPADTQYDSSRVLLTHLEVLGPMPIGGGVPPTAPTVICVFSGRTAERQPFTVVSRWDLKDSTTQLHPSFDQLGARRASVSSTPVMEPDLWRLDDIVIDKCVIGVSAVTMGTMVAFTCSDGLFEFRDRIHLQPFPLSPPNGRMSNLIQAGFAFTKPGPCIDLVLSPNNTVAVRLGPDHEVHLMVMEFTRGPVELKENMEISCVALALQHAYSCSNYLNNDDLLLVARKYRSSDFNITFLTEVHLALNLKMDFAIVESPSERLVKNPQLQRCLSLQFALDFKGEQVKKELSGKLAWATLHLRVAALAFALTLNAAQRQGARPPGASTQPDDFRPEALQSLLGLVRWVTDMMAMIVGDLFELAKACRSKSNDLTFVRQKMLEGNSPALILVLASAPRAFLKYLCRSLKGLEASTGKLLQAGPLDEDQRTTFYSFKVPLDSCAVKIGQFERMLSEIDGAVRATYHNVTEPERAIAERQLFVDNALPPVFAGPTERLLSITLPALKKDINVSALFFRDVSWLGFHDDVESRVFLRKHRIDAVRKIVLPRNIRLRRCTRCCSVVDESVMAKTQGFWLSSFNRMCLCGTLWMHLSGGAI